MLMRILITGSSGFIGSNLCKHLNNVLQIDSKEGFDIERSKNIIQEYDPEIVIHLASHSTVKQTDKNPVEASQNIVGNTLKLLQWTKPKQFIYSSSSMVYGNFTDGVTETTIPNPLNLYGLLKLTVENILKMSDINYTIIRPSAVYGIEDKKGRVIPSFIKNAQENIPLFVDGDNKADFTYIDDVVDAIKRIIGNTKTYKQIYNLTKGSAISLQYAANYIITKLQSSSKIYIRREKNFPLRGSLNCNKLQQHTGWKPDIYFEKGIDMICDYEQKKSSSTNTKV